MNLKKLALIKTSVFFILVVIGFVFGVPVAYVPEDVSSVEFVLIHLIFMVSETLIITYMFIHMLQAADIDFDSNGLKKVFS